MSWFTNAVHSVSSGVQHAAHQVERTANDAYKQADTVVQGVKRTASSVGDIISDESKPKKLKVSGEWKTPAPKDFQEVQQNAKHVMYQADQGQMTLTIDKLSKDATLQAGGSTTKGKLGPNDASLNWEDGTTWQKDQPRDFSAPAVQKDLFSDAQCDWIVDTLAEKIDLGFMVSDQVERTALKVMVKTGNEWMKNLLGVAVAQQWADVIITLLDDTKSKEEKQAAVHKVTSKELRDPLIKNLNGKIDIPFVSEKDEGKILGMLVDQITKCLISLLLNNLGTAGAAADCLGSTATSK